MSKELEIINEDAVVLVNVGEVDTTGADRLLKIFEKKILDLDLENVEVNEDTVREIKAIRTDLNKELANVKSSVREVKKVFNEPITKLDEKVKLIETTLNDASLMLRDKITEYEDNLKLEKENKLRELFEDTKKLTNERLNELNENIDFVTFEDVNLNVTLSASMVSLERQLNDYLEGRYNDMLVVNSHPYADRLRVKYVQLKHLGNAQVEVQKDVALEEKLAQQRKEVEAPKVVEEVKTTPIIERKETVSEIIEITFKVTGTKEELKAVREFMRVNGIKYE